MKILMMTNTYTPIVGGVERSIISFTDKFRIKGHDVKVVAPTFPDMPDQENDVVRLPAIQEFNGTDFSVNLPVPGVLSDFFKEYKPDIIHSHHPFLVGGLALRLSHQYSVPIVFTYHTMFEEYIHYFPVQNEKVRSFVVQLAAGYADLVNHVIVPSESVRNILSERDISTPMTVVPTGIDVKRFKKGDGKKIRNKFSLPKDDVYVIGHLGRLAPEKNLAFLTQSVAEMIKKNKKVHYLVVGSGPSENEIKKCFKDKGISDRLHLTGVLKKQDLVDAYHAMDLFAFSSQSETQGVVLTEAMAAGVPIVAVDATGVREVVKDKINGRMIDNEDEDKFISALKWCVDRNPEQTKKLKSEALKTAKEFSMDLCAEKMLCLYEKVISDEYISREKEGMWHSIMNRIQIEWDLLKNIKEAGEVALSEKE